MRPLHKNTILQILFWGSFWLLVPVLLSGDWDKADRFLVKNMVVLVGIATVVLVNMEVLLPQLFFKSKQTAYWLAGLALLIVVVKLVSWEAAPWAESFRPGLGRPHLGEHDEPSPKHWMRLLGQSMPFFTAWVGTAVFELAAYARRKEQEMAVLRSEKLESELKFLKSQVNPHFLFNALNNIYTLTVLKSDAASGNLLKLSAMLRYVLYDCKEATVPLGKEIEYLRHFIALNLLKDSRGLNVKAELDDSRPELRIAPMLFIPFVENAFKHSKVEDLANGWIDIRLKTDEAAVTLEVRNSLPKTGFTKNETGGIGLENVRRQLELLYPNRHELRIEKGKREFKVHLKLSLANSQ
ncbi:MAG: histidine kinase [Saprospiraceae bacterium]|nr:histidine kinase [Saprospiraceae bacterium]